ncbi:symmetrical bis(5'-nucleosyl)-tetraphosphatase [Sulfurivermis fontis]|uniref:symmetrical bis(5'-nucleosyl)-tetraphosphatase n=1 Tax=Sulfurivermis fontis TaxID=1972068 RepID=UPI000FD7727B|nr:symmetrical bis(5'-nucleosyl)-tetraphosphatase [Sulfurivermis fontis]
MSTYAIGDIQGCYDQLLQLLEQIRFDPSSDRLWFAGDLVNRGPKSLQVLRFVRDLGDNAITVLGNHDLHLLAVWQQKHHHFSSNDTLLPIMQAPDRDELCNWLRRQPLLHHDAQLDYVMVHAGLPPQWDLATARRLAGEVETVLRGDDFLAFMENMYGNKPKLWKEELRGWDRLRFAVNCFTRLRFCTAAGELDFHHKGKPGSAEPTVLPWFAVPGRRSCDQRILFGHWSTLGFHRGDNVCALDTGCLWGGALTALRLEDGTAFHIDCPATCAPGAE